MSVRIDPEFQALIPPLTDEERTQLEANLKTDGCRDPLVVWNGMLLDGHNRFSICQRNGIQFKMWEMHFEDRDAAKAWVIRNQFGRRNLTPYVRAELALKLEPLIAEKAKENQGTRTDLLQNSAKSDSATLFQPTPAKPAKAASQPPAPVNTRQAVASAAGVSHDTIHKAKVIAEKAPESVKEKLRAGDTTIHREYKAIVKAERKAEQVEAVKTAKLPDGKFHVIVADPPWNYESRAADPTHRAANPYPSMSLADIKAMPVEDRAHDNCILWLWTTNAFMVQAHEVAREWGFEVKTILTWGKDRMGTGDWLRGQTEHCLMCVRGAPVVTLTNQTTLLRGPLREHSRKPNEFYALVEALCPGRKCELFSREDREGWQSFGAEVGLFSQAA